MLTLPQVASLANVSVRTVERWISPKRRASLRLKSVKVGGVRRVRELDWKEFSSKP